MNKLTSTLTACAALILLSVGVSPVANAAPWTFFSSGTIYEGYDTTGVFGNISADLTGQTYSQLITLDPTTYSVQYNDGFTQSGYGSLTGTVTTTITVNSVSQTFTWDLSDPSSYGNAYLHNPLTQSLSGFDEAAQYQAGLLTDGRTLNSQSGVASYANSLNLGLNYDQVWSYNTQSNDIGGWSFFDLYSDPTQLYQTTYFRGNASFTSINAPITAAVPEPETYAMTLAGLGLVGFMARRRKQNIVV